MNDINIQSNDVFIICIVKQLAKLIILIFIYFEYKFVKGKRCLFIKHRFGRLDCNKFTIIMTFQYSNTVFGLAETQQTRTVLLSLH